MAISGWKYNNENENAAYKCCFCCHVRTGTLILGLITLVVDLVFFVRACLDLGSQTEETDEEVQEVGRSEN